MFIDVFAELCGLTALVMLVGALSREELGARPRPPVAPRRRRLLVRHGDERIDDYYWLRDREDPEVTAYLDAENKYTDAVMEDTAKLRDKLFGEITSRIRPDDASVPYRFDEYYYYTRYETGQEYPLHCRRRGSLDAGEFVMLNEAELAGGHDYYRIGGVAVSHRHDIVAFAADTVGRRLYTVHFKELTTGEMLTDRIEGATGNMAWANDNRTLFYSKRDPETLRSFQVYRHVVGSDDANDTLIYEERDPTFSVSVHRSKSKRYIFIASHQTITSECRYLDADNPDGEFALFLGRERGHEYEIHHYGEHFYILTNDGATNFRLMRARCDRPGRQHWEEIIPERRDVQLTDLEIFRDHLVVAERSDGLVRLRVIPMDARDEHYVDFAEPAYDVGLGINMHFDTSMLRFEYQSMTTPRSTYDYDLRTRERTLLKRVEVRGGFDPQRYRSERLHAIAEDGTSIPISVVYRCDGKPLGERPLLLYGYGAYGHSMPVTFSPARLSLLDRGFSFALAHVRGGEEMGRAWYDGGRLFEKKNTFTDFISAAEYLVEKGYARPGLLFAQGGSAGGLLVGAVANMRPDLFRGIIANVPFVDVTTTMLDDTIPLTTGEYDEWGDPNRKPDYEYIRSYSPYDNVGEQEYPHMLVTTALHDSQVQYWEPAKWVAKMRELKTDNNLLLLRTEMNAGHGGKSGRFRQYEEVAFEYAFLLKLAGFTSS